MSNYTPPPTPGQQRQIDTLDAIVAEGHRRARRRRFLALAVGGALSVVLVSALAAMGQQQRSGSGRRHMR